MKKVHARTKKDWPLIIALTAVVVLFAIIGMSINKPEKGNSNVITGDLPERFDSNINKLVISEVMSSNGGVYVSSDNELCDYVEIYNGTTEVKNLSGYGLSDNPEKVKWYFPNVTIEPNGYLVVSLSGKTEDGLNANFKLSAAGGEEVVLVNPNKKVTDGVTTVALKKNQVMVRDGNGNWYVNDYGTPGYENSVAGFEAYYASLKGEESNDLIVSEFLAKNAGNFIDKYGDTPGFIELVNNSDHNINLSDYYLSDDRSRPFRYHFTDVTLKPGEMYVLYTTEKDFTRDDTLGFSFSGKKGNIILSKDGKIVNELPYEYIDNGNALTLKEDGNYYCCSVVSPGYKNNNEGVAKFQKENCVASSGLLINEVMNANFSYMAQNSNKYYDWIELYNNSNASINLSDYNLTTSLSDLSLYKLPAETLQPGEYLVIQCSGNTALSNKSYYHANFKIGETESLYLVKDGKVVDCMFVANIPTGYSFGRCTDYGFSYMSNPTPGKPNSNGNRFVSNDPVFSVCGGVYNNVNSIVVEINGSGNVYYTTDGSTPTTSSKKYSGPITLTSTTVLHVKNYEEGGYGSPMAVNSYIINENHTMPVVSLSMPSSDISYLNGHPSSTAKKKAYIELYENGSSFSIPCSVSLFGGNARYQSKKSYCIRFDDQWGADCLEYPLFDRRDNSVYKSFVLRSGSTDQHDAIIRDILGTSVMNDYGTVDTQDYKSVIVYINGKYWGIYNIREKVGDDFIAAHYNVSKDTVNVFRIDGEVSAGSKKDYNELRAYCRTHNLSNKAYYDYVCTKIDVLNFIDYWIAEGYVTNNDMLNVRYFNSPELDDGKYKYIFYDLDYAWYNINVDWYRNYVADAGGLALSDRYENDIIYALFKNSEFKKLWLERLAYNLENVWSKENLKNRLDEIVALYKPEIARNQKRWGKSVSHWESSIDDLYYWINNRQKKYLSATKSYFGLSEKQMKDYFGDLW